MTLMAQTSQTTPQSSATNAAPTGVSNAASQPLSASLPASTQQSSEKLEQRIDLLERETAGVKQRLDDTFTMFVALGGIATLGIVVFGFLSWYREYQEQKNYRRERTFYEKHQSQERRDYRMDRWLHERREARRARLDETLASQQVESGIKALGNLDGALQAQIKNISGLGEAIEVVTKASNLRLDREQRHAQIETIMADFRKGAEKRYQTVEKHAMSFDGVGAMRWPSLPEDRRRKAISALRAFEHLDDFLKAEKREKNPLEYAKLLHFIGILAYYADGNVEASLDYLTDANVLFGEHAIPKEFEKYRAWNRHFLGVLAKNWPLRNEPDGTSLREARKLLQAAEDYLTMESGQFLTALTLAEVLSYLDEPQLAKRKVDEIIGRIEKLQADRKANPSQEDLLPRAYLLRGNLSCTAGRNDQASADFGKVTELSPSNPYGWLSLALLKTPTSQEKETWIAGYNLLPKPPASEKPETVTKVLILAWGIIASHYLGKSRLLIDYRKAFDANGEGLDKAGKYVPYFFSPLSKTLLTFEDLEKEMSDLTRTAEP